MTRSFNLHRRTFMQGLGATALLAPFAQLPAIRRAHAAASKRVLFVYVPDGCIPDRWHPTGSETSFTLPEMVTPLDAIRQHLVFIDGLTMYSGGATHEGGFAKVLTGVGPKSLDVFLGEELGKTTPHRSLQLGVGATFQNGAGSISYVGQGQPINPDDDPLNAFARVFGGGAVGGSTGSSPELAKLRRKSVLDTSLAELNALRTRLGTTEKNKLDVHLDSLRELESRLTGGAAMDGGAMCSSSAFNGGGFQNSDADSYPKTYHREDKFKQVGELQMDLAAMALACGSTNVVSLTWSHAVSPTRIPETGVSTANHDASHYGEPTSQNAKDFVTLKRWFMDRFVYLIEKLANTPDQGGSLLDNTVVMLFSELGDSNRHDHDRVPFVLAGKAGGALKTGRFLDFRGKNSGENEPHTKLLVSVANLAGVPIESFGFTGKGTGPLGGL